ncbi:MAG TPA: protein kinase [Ktedonobacterales bacterium]
MFNLAGRDLGSCTVLHAAPSRFTDDVYVVRQAAGGAHATVRIVHAALPPAHPLARPAAAAAFAQAAAAVAALEHPYVLPLYDFGERDGLRYLILPDVPAGSLADYLAPGSGHRPPLLLSTAAIIAGQAAAALQAAHDADLVHSTVNLHTLLLLQPPDAPTVGGASARDGQAAEPRIGLADFGLSRFLPGSSLAEPRAPILDCLAPEQRNGAAIPASDQYALGCVVYLLLTGQAAPSGGLGAPGMPRPSQLNPALPPAVDDVLLAALRRDPAERFPRVLDFATALWNALRPAEFAQPAPAVIRAPHVVRQARSRAALPPAALSRRQLLIGSAQVAGVAALGVGCASALALAHKFPPAGASPFGPLARTTQTPVYSQGDSVGFYRPSASTFILVASPTTPNVVMDLLLGTATDLPVAGNWNGTGIATVGVFRPSQRLFMLANANRPNLSVAYDVAFGAPGDLPVIGDWTGSGHDGIGVFRPAAGLFLLRSAITSGGAPDFVITFGQQGDIPLAGDWNGDGKAGIGVYRPSDGTFYLTDMLCSPCSEYATYQVTLGNLRGLPFVGDWQHAGRKGLGLFQPEQGMVHLKNDATHSGAPELSFPHPHAHDLPIAGHWGAFFPA